MIGDNLPHHIQSADDARAYAAAIGMLRAAIDGIDDAIREEIRLEANLECALCKSSGEAGEAEARKPRELAGNPEHVDGKLVQHR